MGDYDRHWEWRGIQEGGSQDYNRHLGWGVSRTHAYMHAPPFMLGSHPDRQVYNNFQ